MLWLAKSLINEFENVCETIGSIQMALSGNFPFHGQSRKHDDTDKISHLNSFRIFKLHA